MAEPREGADDTAGGDSTRTARPERGAQRAPALPRGVGGYELLRELGRGGMGVVYEARSVALDRRVALKLLPPGAGAHELERFLREGRALARLRHPGVVGVYELGSEDGRAFLAMELVEGESLAARLAREGPLPAREAAELCCQLADALEAAHAQQVLHRDLKPHNVLIEAASGRARLTDFGLAKLAGARTLTAEGSLLGSPAYMAPEQARGELERVGPATDVYGLGATLYQLLSGRVPFAASALPQLVQAILNAPPPPLDLLADVPPALEAICLRCLEKAPERRYPSAAALRDDLRRFLADEVVHASVARSAAPTEGPAPAARPGPRLLAGAGLVLLLLAVGAALLAGGDDAPPDAGVTATRPDPQPTSTPSRPTADPSPPPSDPHASTPLPEWLAWRLERARAGEASPLARTWAEALAEAEARRLPLLLLTLDEYLPDWPPGLRGPRGPILPADAAVLVVACRATHAGASCPLSGGRCADHQAACAALDAAERRDLAPPPGRRSPPTAFLLGPGGELLETVPGRALDARTVAEALARAQTRLGPARTLDEAAAGR